MMSNLFGFRWISDGTQSRFMNKYIEFYPKWSGLTIKYCPWWYFDPRPMIIICLFWGELFVRLPFFIRHDKSDECENPEYGFYHYEDAFVICLGNKRHYLYYPWSYHWHRTSYLLKDNIWISEYKGKRIPGKYDEDFANSLWSEKYPYANTRDCGKIDSTEAAVTVEEREWRMRWFPFVKRVSKCIDVRFSNEVGKGTGSWKGGVLGCGWEMLPGETPKDTLDRMSKERVL